MKKLNITKDAAKTWEALDAKQYRQIGRSILRLLRGEDLSDSRLLMGGKGGERRIDVGEYRVVYCQTREVVEVLVIGKRNGGDVYDRWLRMVE